MPLELPLILALVCFVAAVICFISPRPGLAFLPFTACPLLVAWSVFALYTLTPDYELVPMIEGCHPLTGNRLQMVLLDGKPKRLSELFPTMPEVLLPDCQILHRYYASSALGLGNYHDSYKILLPQQKPAIYLP